MSNPNPGGGGDPIIPDPPAGSIVWANPSRITADDGSSSTAVLPAGTGTTQYLRATNFGFSIPSNAVILGIQIDIKGSRSVSQPSLGRVYLYKNATLAGSIQLFGAEQTHTNFSSSGLSTLTFGGATDLFNGTIITPADINASTFGCALKMTAGHSTGTPSTASCTVSVDSVKITIFYQGGVAIGTPSAGSVTLSVGRKYTYAFRNSASGHVGDFVVLSNSTGPQTAKNIPITGMAVPTDTQIDRKLVLATADGGDPSTLYLLADIASDVTTLTDDVPESDLLARTVYFELDDEGFEHGIAANTKPPVGTLPTKHRGRLLMVSGQNIVFSKNVGDVTTSTGTITSIWEESWPAYNFFDISSGAEAPRALLSDGEILYVGTERSIHRIFGSGPEDFSAPEVLFNDVGVLNQECWETVYMDGAPVGTMWLTPDLRIIASDFNSYRDVGTPIQDILNTINTAVAQTVVRAAFGTINASDLYFLSIPTGSSTVCDTTLVFDLGSKSWAVWTFTDNITALMHNNDSTGAQVLFMGTDNSAKLYKLDVNHYQDRYNDGDGAVNFMATAQTSFLNLGDGRLRKLLNEVEVWTNDPFMQVKVEGASTPSEFVTPTVVKDYSFLSTSPFGDRKLYLASVATADRYYRLNYQSNGQERLFLQGYSVEAIPFHRL